MSGIRVTYSGLIAFVVGFLGIITGLIFTLIITRELTLDEFGSWTVIGSLVGYPIVLGAIVSYWTTREVARGIESGKTALVTSTFFSIIAMGVYLVIIFFFEQAADIEYFILLFAIILIPAELFKQLLLSIGLAYKPQKSEYGIFIFEISKIVFVLSFVYFLQMGLSGVILSIGISHFVSSIFLIIALREKIVGTFKIKYVKKWLKFSWVPIYPNLSNLINNFDVIIFTVITSSVGGVAYWAASIAVSRIVHNSVRINKAVYPKLLSDGKREYLQDNLVRVLYFALPLSALSIAFSKPALFALNPQYLIAFPIIGILVVSSFSRTLSDIFGQSLSGIEKVDVNENSSFKDYLKSKLILVPTLRAMQRLFYIAILGLVLFLVSPLGASEIELVTFWALIALFSHIPLTIYLYLLVRKEFSLKINPKPVMKYIGSSVVVFGTFYWLAEQFLEYNESVFVFLPQLLMYIIPSILAYLAITFVIDKNTKKLFNSILNELKVRNDGV